MKAYAETVCPINASVRVKFVCRIHFVLVQFYVEPGSDFNVLFV